MATKKYIREKSKDFDAHFVDQFKMKEALTVYYHACNEAEAAGLEQPPIPNYIGECFLKMARKLGNRYNFRNYSYLDDMIGEAIIKCMKKVRKFDPTRGTSAFSYFTSVIWWEMIAVLSEEKKMVYTKNRAFLSGDLESYSMEFDDDQKMQFTQFIDTLDIGPDALGAKKKTLTPDQRRKRKFDATPSPLFPDEPLIDDVDDVDSEFLDADLVEDEDEDHERLDALSLKAVPTDDGGFEIPVPPSDIFTIKIK